MIQTILIVLVIMFIAYKVWLIKKIYSQNGKVIVSGKKTYDFELQCGKESVANFFASFIREKTSCYGGIEIWVSDSVVKIKGVSRYHRNLIRDILIAASRL